MESDSQKLSPTRRRLILLASLLLISALRLHTFNEPLEADESIMAVIAHDWAAGGKPYITAWENKPIGAFAIYRIGIAWFGYSENGIHLTSLLATLVSTFLLFLLLKENSDTSFLGPMLIWIPLTVWPDAFANGANAEIFLLPFILGGLYFLKKSTTSGSQRDVGLASACLIGSLLVKQVTFPFLILPLVCSGRSLKKNLWLAAGILIGTIAVHAIVYRIFGYDGQTIQHITLGNLVYAAHGHGDRLVPVFTKLTTMLFQKSILWLSPFFLLGLGFSVYQWRRGNRLGQLYLAAFLCAAAAVVAPGWERPHYFIVLLPILPLLVSSIDSNLFPRISMFICGFAVIVLFFRIQFGYINLDPRLLSKIKYDNLRVNWFLRDRYIGRQAQVRGYTGGTAYVSGSHPSILFYSDNRPAVRYFVWWMHLLPGVPSIDVTWNQLRTNPPQFLFFPETTAVPPDLYKWMKGVYSQIDNIDRCEVWALNRHRLGK